MKALQYYYQNSTTIEDSYVIKYIYMYDLKDSTIFEFAMCHLVIALFIYLVSPQFEL